MPDPLRDHDTVIPNAFALAHALNAREDGGNCARTLWRSKVAQIVISALTACGALVLVFVDSLSLKIAMTLISFRDPLHFGIHEGLRSWWHRPEAPRRRCESVDCPGILASFHQLVDVWTELFHHERIELRPVVRRNVFTNPNSQRGGRVLKPWRSSCSYALL